MFGTFGRLFGIAAVALACSAVVPASPSAAQTTDVTAYVRQRHDRAVQVLRRNARTPQEVARRNAELNVILGELLDFDELAKRSLGGHWDARTPAERAEFVRLLRALVEKNYQRNLNSTLTYEIRYLGEQRNADGVVVQTSARSRGRGRAPEVTIDYALREGTNGWRVFDVVTDGVSLVRNYRTQFNRIIQRDGFASLMQRMQTRLEAGEEL